MNIRSFPLLRAGILATALAVAAAASAQSSVGAISGEADPTDTVFIQNMDTGVTREITPKANGRFQLRNLPTGNFSVTVKHADGSFGPARMVTLHAGQTVRVQ